MGFSKSILAYDDVREVLDQALASESGVRLKFGSNGQAVSVRQRFNSFRKSDRGENRKIYAEDHLMHGRSVYDKLVLKVPKKGEPDDNYLYIHKRSAAWFEIEPLSDPVDPPVGLDLDVSNENVIENSEETGGSA